MTAGCRSYVEKYDIPQLRCVRVAADADYEARVAVRL